MLPLLLVLAATGGPKTVVMELKTSGSLDPDIAKTATLLVPTEVRRYAEGTVISGEDIRSLLGLERQKQLLGCRESECLAEIAGALGADELVDGTLGKLGNTYLIELHRVDTHKARTRNSVARTVRDQDELLGALRNAVAELYGRAPPSVGLEATTPASRQVSWPAVAGGAGLFAAGAVGSIWALSVHSAVVQQQSPAAPPTVSTSTAKTASVVFPVSIAAGIAGVGLAAYGLLHGSSDSPPELTGDTTVTVAPSPSGASIAVAGRF